MKYYKRWHEYTKGVKPKEKNYTTQSICSLKNNRLNNTNGTR